jgi:MFS family permease
MRPIRNLRWWIGGLLFASTVINYIDRQTLALLSPYLKEIYNWTNTDYANLLIGFRVAYTVGQTVCGRLMDRVGTRRGLSLSVLWYSIVSIATSFASGFYSFATFRFFLGAGESANWPGATKAVSEWFPKQERALATAFFDSGSSIGGAIAPFLILPIYFRWGWRPVFVIPGLLGLIWLFVWRRAYYPPREHPRLGEAEREMGNDYCESVHRSSVVLYCRLVSDLFSSQRNFIKERVDRDLDSFYRGRSRQFFWRSSVRIFDQAGLDARCGAQSACHIRRIRSDAAHSHDPYCESCGHHRAVCSRDVLLRHIHDDRERAAVRSV